MTKDEIYERVVRLTEEISETHVARRIFYHAKYGNVEMVNAIIDSFSEYYPNLFDAIAQFGWEYNKMVGNSAEDIQEFDDIWEDCASVMYNLAGTKIIADIIDAEQAGDTEKVMEAIKCFREKNPELTKKVICFQKRYSKFCLNEKTGSEGAIFGSKPDSEKGVYVFDTTIIDPLSFYVLTMLAGIREVCFFCEEDENGNYYSYPDSNFISAIAEATNETFADFVACYNAVDCVGPNEDYRSFGELLADVFNDRFKE